MCTSLSLFTNENHNLFARTMDFPTKTPWKMTFLPKTFKWQPKTEEKNYTSQHAILGGMRYTKGKYLMGDGINDTGLCCAELYFPVAAKYHSENQPDKINLSPQDFITWVLTQNSTVDEVVQKLPTIAIIGLEWFDRDGVYPFHWVLTDASGKMTIIEPTSTTLTAIDDPVHVLTNTPKLENHITNLNRYVGIDSNQFTDETRKAIINYSGKLPHKTIPTDRFIKTALAVDKHPKESLDHSVSWIFCFLDKVKMPKTSDYKDYTHYIGIIDTTDYKYWFKDLVSNQIQCMSLPDLMAKYELPHTFQIKGAFDRV